jgi:hypothetical protein
MRQTNTPKYRDKKAKKQKRKHNDKQMNIERQRRETKKRDKEERQRRETDDRQTDRQTDRRIKRIVFDFGSFILLWQQDQKNLLLLIENQYLNKTNQTQKKN